MTPEGKVTAAIVRYLKRLREEGRSVWWFKVHGGSMQQAGVPDLAVVYEGRSVWLEVKAAGGRVSPIQAETIRRITLAGGTAAVVRSVEDVRQLLERISRRIGA